MKHVFREAPGFRAGLAALVLLAAAAAGCSGGGGSAPSAPGPISTSGTPTPNAPSTSSSSSTTATIIIKWPTTSASSTSIRVASASRRPNDLSPSTASVSITINGGTPTIVNNPNLAAGSSAPTQTTTVNVPAPLGSDTFVVSAYDKANAGGNLLDQASVPFTVVVNAANIVPITLNGNLAQIACAGVAPIVGGTAPNFTMVGAGGQLTLTPLDADKNVIVAPGTIPSLSLTAGSGGGVGTQNGNTFTINVSATNSTVAFTASGTNLAGTTVTSTCNVTRVPALYVSNHLGSTVAIYRASASGSATPVAVIAGSNTNLASNQFVAADAKGNVFVSNQGPMPGATFGPNAGYVAIYPASGALNGNIAPTSYISGLGTPEGLAFDKNGNLFVMEIDRIEVYPPSSNGLGGAAAPSNVITGSKTGLFSCYGLALDAATNIYAACSNAIEVYPAGSTGNVAAGNIEYVVQGVPGMSFNSRSWLDVAVDAAGNVIAPASNNNLNMIDVYSASQVPTPPATVSPAPAAEAAGVGFSQPLGDFVDGSGTYYVGNYGNNTIELFSSLSALESGIATSTLTESGTGLTGPYGVYVR